MITHAKAGAGGVTPGDTAGFPVTLSLKGSYLLQSNLNPPAGKDGIQIKSHDVTIDFNGFAMDGVHQARTGIRGNGAAADRFNTVTIRNGIIIGFKEREYLGPTSGPSKTCAF